MLGPWTLFNLILHKALKNLEQRNTILNRLTQICGYARSLPVLEALCEEPRKETGRVGLVVSPDKTGYTRFSAAPSRRSVKRETINGVTYERVAEFIYLGTLTSNDDNVEKEIQRRILASNRTYFAAIRLFRIFKIFIVRSAFCEYKITAQNKFLNLELLNPCHP